MATEITASFLSDEDVRMIRSISIVQREEHLCLSFEVNRGYGNKNDIYTIPFAPKSQVKIDDIILPEQVVFVSIPNKIGKYAWRFGDHFSIDFSPFDPYTSRILSGQLNRDEYFKELLEEKKREEEKKQELLKKQEKERLNQKGSWMEEKLPIILGILFGLLLLFSIVYYGAIKQTEGFFDVFCCLIFALFLVPLLLLCKRIWKKLNAYSVCVCIALSITMCIFSIRGISSLVNGGLHKDHYHYNSHQSSKNGFVGGLDPFPDENVDVYITRYGYCYHSSRNCYEIKKSKHISKVSKKKAKRRGYVPCSACY